jgi:hypothetical protein
MLSMRLIIFDVIVSCRGNLPSNILGGLKVNKVSVRYVLCIALLVPNSIVDVQETLFEKPFYDEQDEHKRNPDVERCFLDY